MRTVTISAAHVGVIADRVSRLNRRADRLGVPAVQVTFGPVRAEANGEFGAYEVVDATVSVDTVRLAGWEFVGSIDHSDGIVRSHPNTDFDGLAAFASDPRCEHCNINVGRKVTYVVRHEDGSVKQVGSTCIKDFLGHSVNTTVWEATSDLLDEAVGWGWGEAPTWSLSGFLALTSAVIRSDGWVSRSVSRERGIPATADTVVSALVSPSDRTSQRYTGLVNDDDRSDAESAIAWAEAQDSEASDYAHNVAVIVSAGVVRPRTDGIAASILATYRRSQQREFERASRAECPVAHGDKATIIGTVTKVDTKYTEWGAREVLTVQSDAGWLAWGTVPKALADVEVGERVEFSAVVERSDDPTFVFFKRPSKARSLAVA